MSLVSIACVVEGASEVAAVPILLRRIAQKLDPQLMALVPRPVRVRRDRVFDDLPRAMELALASIKGSGAVLILLDSDDDCPAQLGPDLLRRAQELHGDVLVAVVLAKREYEAWFLAAAESLRGRRGLAADLSAPDAPEGIRGAKEWLRKHMPRGRKYAETADQPALTDTFDLDLARKRAESFDKCYREIERLLRELQKTAASQEPTAEKIESRLLPPQGLE